MLTNDYFHRKISDFTGLKASQGRKSAFLKNFETHASKNLLLQKDERMSHFQLELKPGIKFI